MCVSLMLLLVIKSLMGEEADLSSYSFWCNVPGYSVVEARFGAEQHLLCLKMVPIGSSQLTKLSRIYLEPDIDERPIEAFIPGNVKLVSGFPLVSPSAGAAEGYIGKDGHFYGVLHLGNRTMYADPYNRDDPHKIFGPFEDGSFVSQQARPRRQFAQHPHLDAKAMLETEDPPPGTARARICDLLLLADKEFYDKDAHGSLNHAVSRMIHAVAQADIIIRNADFDEDGMPDNIGFSVKYILVLASKDTNARVFGDALDHSVDGRTYLKRFSRLRRLGEVCLGIAFSGHSFQNRTLGLSFTSLGGGIGGSAGGLCDRRKFGRSFNTLAIAHATGSGDERVPERIAALTLAHEIGHSFGAHHDDNFPNKQCRGFLMGAQSTAADSPSHFEFSLCSKRLIASTLDTVSHCLYEEWRPFCGNGIVEEGEACDCGLPVRCVFSDPCCTPRTGGAEHFDQGTLHKSGCAVAPTAACHPSQGPCCTSKCQLANLTEFGIDCTTQQQVCACSEASCQCGLGGRCLSDGSCHAAECASQGLRECQCTTKTMVSPSP
ncbi:disintegrin and metalloproteinase domain-containing protein 10-like [Leguminivora glycinivorella]|uniref:disintegrin and metalloproteinase domain-containing protein 10-like n=1 Tax=Leguminivora glycinivorella TaxID=1035111 RepID=UPI00200FF3E1|nr:disintegrin and metalloproteinase domain-containing protein 10-like [Leguminivora glycinivorella]